MSTSHTILIICLLRYGLTEDCSNNCECCFDNNCNMANGKCQNGCIDGYYGERCRHRCYDSCKTCAIDGYCTSCKGTTYGQWCNTNCDTNCITCAIDNGRCTSCFDGKYGQWWCNSNCNTNCKTCAIDDGKCTSCYDGKYSQWWCDSNCNTNCKTCAIDDGRCTSCYDGKYGQGCTSNCNTNCKTCDIDDGMCTSCYDGKYGQWCNSNCKTTCKTCAIDDGRCTSCFDGKYGQWWCDSNCNTNCKTCDIDDGRCTSCYDGKYGQWCNSNCKTTCKTCAIDDGRCTSCFDGKYGQWWCDSNCNTNCKTCAIDDGRCTSCFDGKYSQRWCDSNCNTNCKTCSINNDKCTSCIDGKYGQWCNSNCKTTCKTCAIDDGRCTSCFDGKYGQWWCDSNCNTNCKTCAIDDGRCTSCYDGKYGQGCTSNCNTNCKTCDIDDGMCTSCYDGKYGQWCNSNCKTTCKTCAIDDGRCTSCFDGKYDQWWCNTNCYHTCKSCSINHNRCTSCFDGTFGRWCTNNCNTNCKTCDIDDGTCTSCTDGKYGQMCNFNCTTNCKSCTNDTSCESCENGYYGKICSNNCSNNCLNNTCDNMSGHCDNCPLGRQGSHCENCKVGFYYSHDLHNCLTCPGNCRNVCNNQTGICDNGCLYGFWGSACNKDCSKNCVSCTQSSGECDSCISNTMYGTFCNTSCSDYCYTGICEQQTAKCLNGCIENHYGERCEHECHDTCVTSSSGRKCAANNGTCLYRCINGYYGSLCTLLCDKRCVNNTCDYVSGKCVHGCEKGYVANEVICAQELAVTGKGADSSPSAAIGGSVGGVVLAAIIVILLVIFVRRWVAKRAKNDREDSPNEYANIGMSDIRSSGVNIDDNVYTEPQDIATSATESSAVANPGYQFPPTKSNIRHTCTPIDAMLEIDEDEQDTAVHSNGYAGFDDDTTYYNSLSEVNKTKVSVNDLAAFVADKEMVYFNDEFEKFSHGLIKPHVDSQTKENMAKNRYKGLYPYDDSRVKVNGGDTDYINASYIDGYRKRNEYIASLGPTVKQMRDFGVFWRMLWQQKVEKIVMLTNLSEEGKPKCDQYWPTAGTEKTYSDIKVICHSEDEYAEFTLRFFTLSKDSTTRSLQQLHFTAWPDKGTPEDVTGLVEFRQKVRNAPAKLDGPTVVHCSAGVGRTGTYIALDILTKEGEADSIVDIPGCVRNMRQNRPNMVQTAEQYQYLHNTVVHSLTYDCKPIQGDAFQTYMAKTSNGKMDTQFQKLNATVEKRSKDVLDAVARNKGIKGKNRPVSDIPGDENRPRLHLSLKPGSSDYVNAVYINSYKTKRRYLVAQSPLPNTVPDFLTLVFQENCSCIVSFEPSDTEKRKDIGVYYPADNQVLRKGVFNINCSRDDSTKYSSQRKLKIAYHGRASTGIQEKTVPHLQFTDWNTQHNTPNSATQFLQFINDVEIKARESSQNGPILIHCVDGAGKSGLFCVVSILLQKMEIEHEVSVVNTVRQVKSRRPLAIPNKEQFHFCHDCVQEYLRSFDTYSNFGLRDTHRGDVSC